jgi:hypothetical protein
VRWVAGTESARSIPLGVFAPRVGGMTPRDPLTFWPPLGSLSSQGIGRSSVSTMPTCWISCRPPSIAGWRRQIRNR